MSSRREEGDEAEEGGEGVYAGVTLYSHVYKHASVGRCRCVSVLGVRACTYVSFYTCLYTYGCVCTLPRCMNVHACMYGFGDSEGWDGGEEFRAGKSD